MILFKKDWAKYPKAILHTKTKNESFLKLAYVYKEMGVENHAFILALTQPELEFIDPHDTENLTTEDMARVVAEVTVNPWYYFREVAKAPALAGVNNLPFRANRGNIGLYWMFFNHITTLLIQPRQTGKSFSTDTLMIYLLNYACSNTFINMITRSGSLRAENLDRLKKLQDELPFYINFKTKDDIFNTEEIRLKALGNVYRGNLSNMSPKLANNVGRGFVSPILHGDEVCFIPNIGIALAAALMAGNAARDAAKLNNNPYGTILSTTTGTVDDRDSGYIYRLWNSATVLNEKFYDAEDEEDLKNLLYTNSNSSSNDTKRAIVNITMSYRQLGYDDEWMRAKLAETLADGLDADRDLFNRWTTGTETSPVPKEYLEILKDNINEQPRIEIFKPHNYILNWYIDEDDAKYRADTGVSFIIGIDTSDGIGRDDIALAMRDSTTGEIICTGVFNELNLITLADFFVAILVKYHNSVMIIERKSSAIAIIDYMIQKLVANGIHPFTRLYNTIIQDPITHEDQYNLIQKSTYYNEELFIKNKKHIGFNTSAIGPTSRSELYSTTLISMLKYTAANLRDMKLINQILTLVIKNGRVDHPEGGNDDLLIAALLSYWLMINGKNLSYYNIDTTTLLRSNEVYLSEKYSSSNIAAEESKEIEAKFNKLLEELKEERDNTVCKQLEFKIRFLASDLTTNYNSNLSVEHMLEDIRRDKKIKRRY